MTDESRPFRCGTLGHTRPGRRFRPVLSVILLVATLAGCSHHITHIYIEESPGREGLPQGADQIAIGIIQEVAKKHEFIFVSTNQSSSRVLAYYTKGSIDLRLFKDSVSQSLIFVLKDFDSWDPTPTSEKMIRDITRLAAERLPETTVVSTSQRDHFPYGP
jgi:hypothetical protein